MDVLRVINRNSDADGAGMPMAQNFLSNDVDKQIMNELCEKITKQYQEMAASPV